MYKLLSLLRTFFHATQGTPVSMKFYTDAAQNGTFVGEYTLDTSIEAPTEIYFSQDVYYPEGYKLSVLVDGKTSETLTVDNSQRNYLKLWSFNAEEDEKTVNVVLTKPLSETQGKAVSQENGNIGVSYSIQELSAE